MTDPAEPVIAAARAFILVVDQAKDTFAELEAEDVLRAALAALDAAPDGWLPIESAPTDGQTVLVWAAPYGDLPGFQSTAAHHPDAGWCVDELRKVTHWRPLPPPPETSHGKS